MQRTLGIILLFVVALGAGIWLATLNQPAAPPPPAPKLGGDFTLMSDYGPVSLHDHQGQVVVLAFGYTSCPDVCPLTLSIISAALKQLTPDELKQVQPIFVTLDPERDTPARVGEYARHFHPRIIGLSGTPEQIAKVAKEYLVVYRKETLENSALGYGIDHSSRIYILNRAGHYVDSTNHLATPQEMLAKIRAALQRG